MYNWGLSPVQLDLREAKNAGRSPSYDYILLLPLDLTEIRENISQF